jgi:signal transduction histidine kinase/CheY-like chemotaxis protein
MRRRDQVLRGAHAPVSRRWFLLPGAVLMLGFLSFAVLIGTNWINERLIVQDVALLSAIGELQRDAAISHLWLEEHVSGDVVPVGEINRRVAVSHAIAKGILEGRLPDRGTPLGQLDRRDLRQRAKSLKLLLEQFDGISRSRQHGFEVGGDVGVGSDVDTLYDRVFAALLEDAQFLEKEITLRLEGNQGRSRLLLRVMLVAWLGLVGLAVTGMWTRERRRLLAEAALSQSEAQLLQAQKMEAVGRLAGGIAHDINNYVAAITAQCELAKRKAVGDARLVQRLDTVVETAHKVSALIKRLLAFSRRVPVQQEVVNLNQVVAGLERMMRRLIGEDVRLVSRLAPELWSIRIDPSQLEQVIVNLLVNARDAMPTGGTVTLTTANRRLSSRELATLPGLAARECVLLTVRDTGGGIPPELLDKIFEPFFTTKEKSGNTGIGLSTVYAILRNSGGAIAVTSAVEAGTTVNVYLPRCREAVAPAAEAALGSEVPGGRETLLLVEDNDDLRDSTEAMLQSLGYRVLVAADGFQALERFTAVGGRVDLVVADVVMPEMSGPELVARIRATRPEVQALFVSGYADHAVLHQRVLDREVDFLDKPYSADRLARKIREVLDRATTTPRAAAG